MNKATGKKITLLTPPAPAYPGNGAFTLVDGIQNEKGLGRSSEFLGFSGKDMEVIIDLNQPTEINRVTIHVMDQGGSWVYLPKAVEVTYLTAPGFSEAERAGAPRQIKQVDPIKEKGAKEVVVESRQTCRYVHILVRNFGIIPSGNQGAGNPAWLFVDEIEIE
jgi:hexosaminidase